MRVARNLRLSVGAMFAHPLRASLAIGGTAIGVAGVLVLTAMGAGARSGVLEQIEALGGDLLVVTRAPADARPRLLRDGPAPARPLDPTDADAVRSGSFAVVRVASGVDRAMIARAGRVRTPASVLGTTPEWRAIRDFALADGRFFTAAENEERARVAVLGADIRAALFPDSVSAIGRSIRIGTVPFEVIGVLEAKGISAAGATTEDDRIIVPLETAMRRLFGTDDVGVIFVEATSSESLSAAALDAAAILRARRGREGGGTGDLVIDDQRVLLNARLQTQSSFQRLLFALGSLSLLVATAGILSVLVLSVRERRCEIGLRLAVGGRPSDLLLQFFAEALLLAGTGGVIGILLGLAAAAAADLLTAWDARITTATILLAMSAALATGILSGVWPAWRAATVDPIDALRAG